MCQLTEGTHRSGWTERRQEPASRTLLPSTCAGVSLREASKEARQSEGSHVGSIMNRLYPGGKHSAERGGNPRRPTLDRRSRAPMKDNCRRDCRLFTSSLLHEARPAKAELPGRFCL
jgi:hypothetical protein